jgi:hypothetical protein
MTDKIEMLAGASVAPAYLAELADECGADIAAAEALVAELEAAEVSPDRIAGMARSILAGERLGDRCDICDAPTAPGVFLCGACAALGEV